MAPSDRSTEIQALLLVRLLSVCSLNVALTRVNDDAPNVDIAVGSLDTGKIVLTAGYPPVFSCGDMLFTDRVGSGKCEIQLLHRW